jgi:hypothetical protein
MKKGNNFMDNLMTLDVAALKLNVAESTLRTWKRRCEIPEECFKKIGSRVFIRTDKFQRWVDS